MVRDAPANRAGQSSEGPANRRLGRGWRRCRRSRCRRSTSRCCGSELIARRGSRLLRACPKCRIASLQAISTPRRSAMRKSLCLAAILSGCLPTLLTAQQQSAQPNVLFIMTDQHFADVMSNVMGHEHIKTPHLDQLVESGVRFDRAYAPNPICKPARNSIFSGYYP